MCCIDAIRVTRAACFLRYLPDNQCHSTFKEGKPFCLALSWIALHVKMALLSDAARRGVLFQSSFDTRLSRREISAFACSYSSVSHEQQVSQVKGIIKLEASRNCSESQCGVQSDFMSAATKPQPFPLSLYPFPFSSGRAFFHGRPRLFQFF